MGRGKNTRASAKRGSQASGQILKSQNRSTARQATDKRRNEGSETSTDSDDYGLECFQLPQGLSPEELKRYLIPGYAEDSPFRDFHMRELQVPMIDPKSAAPLACFARESSAHDPLWAANVSGVLQSLKGKVVMSVLFSRAQEARPLVFKAVPQPPKIIASKTWLSLLWFEVRRPPPPPPLSCIFCLRCCPTSGMH